MARRQFVLAPNGHSLWLCDGVWACDVCLRRSQSLKRMAREKCAGVAEHVARADASHKLWRCAAVVLCGRCGAYSQGAVKRLGSLCPGVAGARARRSLCRLLKGLHPRAGSLRAPVLAVVR